MKRDACNFFLSLFLLLPHYFSLSSLLLLSPPVHVQFSGLQFLHRYFLEIPAEMCLEGNCSKMVLVGWGFFPNRMLKDVLKFI